MTCQTTGCGCGERSPGTVQKLKDLAERFYHDPEGSAHDVGHELRALLNTAGEDLQHVGDTVTAQVRAKPVEASFVALGIGVLVGLLMGRR